MFPPHKVYVEPFFGGGAVFFEKEPSEVEVVNDLDSDLIRDYKRVLTAPPFGKAYPILETIDEQMRFLSHPHKDKPSQIVEALVRRCNGFNGRFIVANRVWSEGSHESKLRMLGEYKKRLRQAHLLNQSYEKVLCEYDGDSTFFFLDPPYEMSESLGYAKGSESFDFEALARELRKLKDKFLMTLNDSAYIRKVFKGFKVYRYVVEGHHSGNSIGTKDRPEVLVTNYDLPRKWRGVLKGGDKPSPYLKEARRRAEENGYDPEAVSIAEDGIHKLNYTTPTGKKVSFGRVGYGDFILWSMLEKEGEVPSGTALQKQRVFHASHEAMGGKWKSDLYSPNNLALNVLW